MSNNKTRLRVYGRSKTGTVLLWDTEHLTDEQNDNIKAFIRVADEDWTPVELEEPDWDRMKPLNDFTECLVIKHPPGVTEQTTFEAKFIFGGLVEDTTTVDPKGTVSSYVKPLRMPDGTYAMPVVVVGYMNRDGSIRKQ